MLKISAVMLGLLMSTAALGQNMISVEIELANEDLNETYRILMHRLSPADQARLRIAQRAWLAFRDADCGWRADICFFNHTITRDRQLRFGGYADAAGKGIEIPYDDDDPFKSDDCPKE